MAKGPINNYIYLHGEREGRAAQRAGNDLRQGNGPVGGSLAVESDAPGCKRLLREVRVIDSLDRVEIIDMVDKMPVRAIEGVHFGFAFNVPNPQVRINSPGVVVRPEKDQLPGACKLVLGRALGRCLQRQLRRDLGHGRRPAHGTWRPDGQYAPRTASSQRLYENIAPSATLYSWVMNNHWHTNYRADQEGETTFRYYLHPHGAYDAVAAARFGLESTIP